MWRLFNSNAQSCAVHQHLFNYFCCNCVNPRLVCPQCEYKHNCECPDKIPLEEYAQEQKQAYDLANTHLTKMYCTIRNIQLESDKVSSIKIQLLQSIEECQLSFQILLQQQENRCKLITENLNPWKKSIQNIIELARKPNTTKFTHSYNICSSKAAIIQQLLDWPQEDKIKSIKEQLITSANNLHQKTKKMLLTDSIQNTMETSIKVEQQHIYEQVQYQISEYQSVKDILNRNYHNKDTQTQSKYMAQYIRKQKLTRLQNQNILLTDQLVDLHSQLNAYKIQSIQSKIETIRQKLCQVHTQSQKRESLLMNFEQLQQCFLQHRTMVEKFKQKYPM